MDFMSPAFWVAVLQIILIDILLGGDNAVVIALACRRLPEEQRKKGIFWGVFGAIGLRVIMIFFALQLLAIPYLKIVGAILLLWIGVKLLMPEEEEAHGNIEGSTHLLGAIKTIVVADGVMSLDNVIAVAGAAEGDLGRPRCTAPSRGPRCASPRCTVWRPMVACCWPTGRRARMSSTTRKKS